MRRYWSTPNAEKAAANVDILAPARRHAGLANNESEEALERLMMEGTQNPAASVRTEHALAFATYSRRLTQGMVSVALVHSVPPGPDWVSFVVDLEGRLHRIAGFLRGEQVESGKREALFRGRRTGPGNAHPATGGGAGRGRPRASVRQSFLNRGQIEWRSWLVVCPSLSTHTKVGCCLPLCYPEMGTYSAPPAPDKGLRSVSSSTNCHPERSASPIYRVTQGLWRGVEGPRRCPSYSCCWELFNTGTTTILSRANSLASILSAPTSTSLQQ